MILQETDVLKTQLKTAQAYEIRLLHSLMFNEDKDTDNWKTYDIFMVSLSRLEIGNLKII